jgi:putative phosphoribosyl transferase
MRFLNRRDAGRQLGAKLSAYVDNPSIVVLGLPRGGVPVAKEVARRLNAPLDILIIRKLGVPGRSELAMGAIASGGVRVLNREVIASLKISAATVEAAAASEMLELQRQQQAFRGDIPFPELKGRTAIVVDDGIATGSTMRAAVQALRQCNPARVIVAAPVAAPAIVRSLFSEADDFVCLRTPADFCSVSGWYEDFAQTTDEEVRSLLSDPVSLAADRAEWQLP